MAVLGVNAAQGQAGIMKRCMVSGWVKWRMKRQHVRSAVQPQTTIFTTQQTVYFMR